MAEIKAFKALRFTDKAGKINELCCPPYDIISETERQEFLKTNPNNIIRLELPKEGENPYAVASEILNDWRNSGILECDQKDSIYIYGESFEVAGKEYAFKGIICRVKLVEFEKGIVLPHENTLSKAKNDRFELMKATNCNFSQIYSLYIDKEKTTPKLINSVTNKKPDREFTDKSGVTHSLWVCDDEAVIETAINQFASRKLFIADGHHRYETGINYRNYNKEKGSLTDGQKYIMMMLVDMENEGLVVLPTHRILHGVKDFNLSSLLKKCEGNFNVEAVGNYSKLENKMAVAYNSNKTAIGCYSNGEYYCLTLKNEVGNINEIDGMDNSLKKLDVTVLHSLILEKYMGIDKENLANQVNLKYTRSAEEGIKDADEYADCCFLLNPTKISEIAEVAEAGEKMPQKSTYFYPKLITGLVMNSLDK